MQMWSMVRQDLKVPSAPFTFTAQWVLGWRVGGVDHFQIGAVRLGVPEKLAVAIVGNQVTEIIQ
jgi:hypothetical protein